MKILLLILLFPILAQGQTDSFYAYKQAGIVKFQRKHITGAGVKISVWDTEMTSEQVHTEDIYYRYDYVDNDTSVSGGQVHGGFVASIIKGPGIGIAPGAELHYLRVIENNGGGPVDSNLRKATNYCIANGIDIVNMSFTHNGDSMQTYVDELIAAGIVVVASSGNSTTETETLYPAAYPGVVAINAITEDKEIIRKNVIAPEGGEGVDAACGGHFVVVLSSTGEQATNGGTSMAAPFFAGMLALYIEMLGVDDNYKALQHMLNKCRKQSNTLYFGYGIPQS